MTLTKREIALVRGAFMRAMDWTEGSIRSSSGQHHLKEKRVYKRYHAFLHKRLNAKVARRKAGEQP